MKPGDRLITQLIFAIGRYEVNTGVALRSFAPFTNIHQGGWTCAIWPAGAIHQYRPGEYGISVEWFGVYASANWRPRA